jgi:hypothetical protein
VHRFSHLDVEELNLLPYKDANDSNPEQPNTSGFRVECWQSLYKQTKKVYLWLPWLASAGVRRSSQSVDAHDEPRAKVGGEQDPELIELNVG